MTRFPQRLTIAAGVSELLLFAPVADAKPASQNIDRAPLGSLSRGRATHGVIVPVQPGCRDYVRNSLGAHGDTIASEHPSIDEGIF